MPSSTCWTCRSSGIHTTGSRPRIWSLRANFSAYDAAYVTLAEAITDGGAPLLTADARLARAAGDHTELRVLLAE